MGEVLSLSHRGVPNQPIAGKLRDWSSKGNTASEPDAAAGVGASTASTGRISVAVANLLTT